MLTMPSNQQIINQKKPTLEEQEDIEVKIDEAIDAQHHDHGGGVYK
jgi:hypothetical protein